MSLRILLAEDEIRVQNFIRKGLQEAGMTVDTVGTVVELHTALLCNTYDVLVLDRLLKSSDCMFEVPAIKQKNPDQRILILSAFSDTDQKIAGIKSGADDYLGKPFHISELIVRIQALTRRSNLSSIYYKNMIEFRDLTIELESQRVTRAGKNIPLSFQEFKLLVILASSPEKLFSRTELLNKAWDMNHDPSSNVIDVTIGRLRKKINAHASLPLIIPRRGVGYSLSGTHDLD